MQPTDRREGRQARPLVRAPDALTALRLPLAAMLLLVEDPGGRLAIVLAAGVSDFADGFWARRIGGSRLGVVLDPICDKVFVGTAFFLVYRSGTLAALEILGVLLRDVLAVAGFLVTWVLRRPTTLPARAGGKVVTVGQLATLVAFVLGADILRPLAWATAAISFYAVIDYGQVVWRRRLQ